jgi:hypothetical protein
MDDRHRFHTPDTWWLVRAEYVLAVVALSAWGLWHATEMNWARFVAAFALIDVLGYIPGAVAFRRARGTRIAPLYHHLYNVTHSFLTAAVALALWAWLRGAPEWAMLAVPIHLCGDRGLFGNTYKPLALPFEPHGTVDASAAQEVLRHV